jgi:hypothetical protein
LCKQQTANSKQQTANSKQQTANSKQQTANSKQRTANSKANSKISKNEIQKQIQPFVVVRLLEFTITSATFQNQQHKN